MTQAEHRIDEIEIPVQTLTQGRHQVDMLGFTIPMDIIRLTRLDATEYTDKSFVDPFSLQEFPNQVLFRISRDMAAIPANASAL